jgi:glucokinase
MEPGYLGIEIGGSKLQLVVGDENGSIQDRRRFVVDRAQGSAGIQRQIQSACAELQQQWQPHAVGVGFGGPVDWKSGRICRSHHIEGWSGFELRAWLQTLTHKPVRIDNDANVAALGEASCGAGLGYDPVFYVTLGSGVGGGLVVDSRIYHGASPGEAEIGHVRLDRQGTILESRCSGWAVDERIRQIKASHPTSLLAPWIEDKTGGEAKYLARALQEKDTAAWEILTQTAQDLAFGLSHVVHLFHPAVIVLGGGLSLIGEPLRAAVAESLPRWVMEAFAPGPSIRLAALGEDAVPIGCIMLARALAGEARGASSS